METNIKQKKSLHHKKSGNKRMQDAEKDFKRIMAEVKPFVKKTAITIKMNEGRWYDTSQELEKVTLLNYITHQHPSEK